MNPATHRQYVLAALAVLPAVLERDEQLALTERRRRDRAIGKRLTHFARSPVTQVLEWLRCVGSERVLERARSAAHAVLAILIVIGLLVGCVTAVGAFFYDGTTRVNVLAVLAIFVGLQTLLLFLALLGMLPERALSWLPGAEAITAMLRMMSPGRLALAAQKLLPVDARRLLEPLSPSQDPHLSTHRVQKWLVLTCSQYLALAFNAGAVACALCLVVFSDIAFGWATTLDLGAAGFHRLIEWLALPWSWWLPGAVPSIELVEASRYYRLDVAEQLVSEPRLLGQWWAFVVASMVAYGLLPRILVLVFALTRLRPASEQALCEDPRVQTLLERLNTTLVETTSEDPEAPDADEPGEMQSTPLAHVLPENLRAVIDWADVPVARGWLETNFDNRDPPCTVYRAGGGCALEADQAVVDAIRDSGSTGGVAILTKAWEPPLLELGDFLSDLRQAIGQTPDIVIVPVSAAHGARENTDDANLRLWQHMVKTRQDLRLRLADAGPVPVDD